MIQMYNFSIKTILKYFIDDLHSIVSISIVKLNIDEFIVHLSIDTCTIVIILINND